MISKKWLDTHLPWEQVRGVTELLEEGQELSLEAVNGTTIPYVGWVHVQFCLAGAGKKVENLGIPLLVGENDQELPIIGFNVIEELIRTSDNTPGVDCVGLIQNAFQGVIKDKVQELW